MLAGQSLSAEDFATVARWAFVQMPVGDRPGALFDLFERCSMNALHGQEKWQN
jgi:hypothetical protein